MDVEDGEGGGSIVSEDADPEGAIRNCAWFGNGISTRRTVFRKASSIVPGCGESLLDVMLDSLVKISDCRTSDKYS